MSVISGIREHRKWGFTIKTGLTIDGTGFDYLIPAEGQKIVCPAESKLTDVKKILVELEKVKLPPFTVVKYSPSSLKREEGKLLLVNPLSSQGKECYSTASLQPYSRYLLPLLNTPVTIYIENTVKSVNDLCLLGSIINDKIIKLDTATVIDESKYSHIIVRDSTKGKEEKTNRYLLYIR